MIWLMFDVSLGREQLQEQLARPKAVQQMLSCGCSHT